MCIHIILLTVLVPSVLGTSCVSVLVPPENTIRVCSGHLSWIDALAATTSDSVFFFVSRPCCNPCLFENQSIRYHPSITNMSHQPCFTVTNYDTWKTRAGSEVDNTERARFLSMSGYYLHPLTNTVMRMPPAADASDVKVDAFSCDALTQYYDKTQGCVAKSPVEPRSQYVASYSDGDNDHVVDTKTNCSALGVHDSVHIGVA
eukprot:m.546806 g.546806  ORF g.546806 m.546806 type:complete len:203 (+) comp22155_c0_seq30:1965-2573(+)